MCVYTHLYIHLYIGGTCMCMHVYIPFFSSSVAPAFESFALSSQSFLSLCIAGQCSLKIEQFESESSCSKPALVNSA